MIVIARHCLGHEGGDLVVGETSFRSGLATASENSEGVAVMAGQRDGDFGIFRGDWGRFQESRLSDTGVTGGRSPVESRSCASEADARHLPESWFATLA